MPAMSRLRAEQLAFSGRLADLLATLEGAATIGSQRTRVRGLGEQLRFACLALPCTEALAALEVTSMDRLVVPAVATRFEHREVDVEVHPEGTPLAQLLAGGSGYAIEIVEGDPAIEPLAPALSCTPRGAVFVPIRLGDRVVGGAALLSEEGPMSDAQLEMAERLGEVLAATVDAFFTERALFELFREALPSLLGKDAVTSLPKALEAHIRALRVAPEYRRRLELAAQVGRVAGRSPLEAELAGKVLAAFDAYVAGLEGA
jgi:hypothetical protein